jgi:hypothetical protein
MKIPPYFCYIKITTMNTEKFSFETRAQINLLVNEWVSGPESGECTTESDLTVTDRDELIGTHLLTPHLN